MPRICGVHTIVHIFLTYIPAWLFLRGGSEGQTSQAKLLTYIVYVATTPAALRARGLTAWTFIFAWHPTKDVHGLGAFRAHAMRRVCS